MCLTSRTDLTVSCSDKLEITEQSKMRREFDLALGQSCGSWNRFRKSWSAFDNGDFFQRDKNQSSVTTLGQMSHTYTAA